ncbi:MAG: type II toxin-antitoxin system RelE family toxin [Roseiflexaceae bacterium]
MSYQISYTDEARQALRTLPGNYRQRIRRLIESLSDAPRPPTAKELRNLPNRYRLRLDNWRIIYRVDDEQMTILILRVRRKQGPETYQGVE